MFIPKQFNRFFTLIIITLAFFLSNCSPDENEEETGNIGVIKGAILDNESDELPGVSVAFVKSGETVGTATSDTDGEFYQSSLGSGDYTLTYSKSNYIDTTLSATLTTNTETLKVATVTQLSDTCSTGAISGTIKDAVSNSGVSDVTLSARSGLNTTSGTIVKTATSDSSGNYSLNSISAGWYTVETSKSGYMAATNFNVYSCGDNVTSQDATITTTLSSGSMRIILSWNTNKDLDSHLTGPDSASGKFHVYYGQPRFHLDSNSYSTSGSSSDNVTQDVDSLKGNGTCSDCGPETITISTVRGGNYRYYVHNYTNKGTNNKRLFKSGASVTVYYSGLSNNPTTFNVPSGNGDLWTVFDFNTSSGLTEVGTMGSESSSGKVDDH